MKGEKWIIDWLKTAAKMNHWLNKKAIFYIVNFLNSLTYVLRRGSFEKYSGSSIITRLIKSIWSAGANFAEALTFSPTFCLEDQFRPDNKNRTKKRNIHSAGPWINHRGFLDENIWNRRFSLKTNWLCCR